jgi:uncharacterized membrane protein YeaQ/YmgE (transglycosylase-associated protein family)
MQIVWTVLIAFAVGVTAKLLTPDVRPSGLFLTVGLGIVGALVATYAGRALGIYEAGEQSGFIGAIVGANVVVVVYGLFSGCVLRNRGLCELKASDIKMGLRRFKFHPLNASGSGPPILSSIIPVLAGTVVYFAFGEQLELPGSESAWEELLEVAPALLVGLMFQVFVLLPLRMLFAKKGVDRPILFLVVSTLIWLLISLFVLHGTSELSSGDLWVDASILVPGFVMAAAYTLMNVHSIARTDDV